MKIYFLPYNINSKDIFNAKSQNNHGGILLKTVFNDQSLGFSDFHPWPELGDPSIEVELDQLKQLSPSKNFLYSVELARKYKNAQVLQSLTRSSIRIENHFLLKSIDHLNQLSALSQKGFKTIKLKLNNAVAEWGPKLINAISQHQQFKWRLDFNETLNTEGAMRLARLLQDYWLNIDYLEDPTLFSESLWRMLSKEYHLRIAVDRAFDTSQMTTDTVQVLVLKPSRQNCTQILKRWQNFNIDCVLTHNMDHTVGRCHALFESLQLLATNQGTVQFIACGLLDEDATSPLIAGPQILQQIEKFKKTTDFLLQESDVSGVWDLIYDTH